MDDLIIQDDKHIPLFMIKLNNTHRNNTTIEKKIILIVEWLKKFLETLFGYKINLYSDHNNLAYEETQSEYKRVTSWWLILGEFGPNIQHIAGVEHLLADTISRFLSTTVDRDEPITNRDISIANKLFTTRV